MKCPDESLHLTAVCVPESLLFLREYPVAEIANQLSSEQLGLHGLVSWENNHARADILVSTVDFASGTTPLGIDTLSDILDD